MFSQAHCLLQLALMSLLEQEEREQHHQEKGTCKIHLELRAHVAWS